MIFHICLAFLFESPKTNKEKIVFVRLDIFLKGAYMNAWIWYSSLETMTPIQKKKLLELYGSPEKIFEAKPEDFLNFNFLKESNRIEIAQKRDAKLMVRYEEYMKKNKIQMITFEDKRYPQKLKEIYDSPISFFAKGNLSLLEKPGIGVIGCREATKYGLEVARQMAYDLSLGNMIVVSGMAKGIDAAAHQGAIMASGKTIAVLGTGVDYPYPFCNIALYKEILQKGGLIISEFLVGTTPKPINFPKRNRIISALSEGILVVEAKKKSGTMITVDFALEQGKNIYMIPGNIDSTTSEGTNELIKQGAKLVSNVQDILEDYIT